MLRALVGFLLFYLAGEILTRIGFSHVNRNEARIESEYHAVASMRRRDKPFVLLVGNSLLLEDIEYVRLRASLADEAYVFRLAIEETEYLDWFYGLRRLFSEGAQPDLVLLCINLGHLISSRIRGDYTVYYLLRIRDIPQLRRDLGDDLTQASGLVLSRFSFFYAARNNFRNFALIHTAPGYAEMLRQMATQAPQKIPADPDVECLAEAHFRAIKQLCLAHHAHFSFLLPAGFGPGEDALKRAGERAGTDVLVPLDLNAAGRENFQDNLHLNSRGAQLFTDHLLPQLRIRLENLRRL